MLDEAMAGLNATETIEAVQLIKKIRDRDHLIVVEHVMEVIMSISERVCFRLGKKIAKMFGQDRQEPRSSRPIWGAYHA